MKIIALIGDAPHHRALVNALAKHVPIEQVIIEQRPAKKKSAVKLASLVFEKILCRPIYNAWRFMLKSVGDAELNFEPSHVHVCKNVNNVATRKRIAAEKPDLIVVSGTSLLKPKLIDVILRSGKIMNMHTGISPYVNGGPNCTNWCIKNGRFDLIGSTVMWLDAGIDTGNILATGRPQLTGNENLGELQVAVMEHAHESYINAIVKHVREGLGSGVAQSSLPDGVTYYTKQWTLVAKLKMLYRFYTAYNPKTLQGLLQKNEVILVNL